MAVMPAEPADVSGFLALAAEVEDWFGPMVADPEFHATLDRNIRRGTALVVRAEETGLLGGMLIGGTSPAYRINWLVVAARARGRGIGRKLVLHAIQGMRRPCRLDVVTFGDDHPGAVEGGARAFYERLGFVPGDRAPRGPEGGTRQWYHLELAAPHA